MCDFCDTTKPRHERTESGATYSPKVYIEKDENYHSLYAVGESGIRFIIEYCPKCGEYLK